MNRNLLQHVYLFKTMSMTDLDAISEMAQIQTFSQGDTIFIKGEAATAMYLIKHGSIRIQQTGRSGDAMEIAMLGTGSHFGEMSFIDGEPRSASAVAVEKTELIVLNYEKLKRCLEARPEAAVKMYRELAHFLAGRLRLTTNDLSYAREKNLSHF